MWPDDEKAAENTCRIVKGFEEVWTHFCPPKPCFPLSTDTTLYRIDSVKKRRFCERAEHTYAAGSRKNRMVHDYHVKNQIKFIRY